MGHGGVLNFRDAFSYALARTREAPSLFIGEDFGTTDIAAAFAPRHPLIHPHRLQDANRTLTPKRLFPWLFRVQ